MLNEVLWSSWYHKIAIYSSYTVYVSVKTTNRPQHQLQQKGRFWTKTQETAVNLILCDWIWGLSGVWYFWEAIHSHSQLMCAYFCA